MGASSVPKSANLKEVPREAVHIDNMVLHLMKIRVVKVHHPKEQSLEASRVLRLNVFQKLQMPPHFCLLE